MYAVNCNYRGTKKFLGRYGINYKKPW
jgi:hypothetical protein